MKTLRLTAAESAAYAAGERRFWRAMRKQPDRVPKGEPYWFVGGFRLHPSSSNPLPCPYGTPGDRIVLMQPSFNSATVSITAITVEQRDGKWGWEIQVAQ
mgnify:CR=1 FL=1